MGNRGGGGIIRMWIMAGEEDLAEEKKHHQFDLNIPIFFHSISHCRVDFEQPLFFFCSPSSVKRKKNDSRSTDQ